MYGVTFAIISERAKRASSLLVEFTLGRVQLRFQIRTYIYMWPYVNLYAHAQWYVMWEELSEDHFLKHSNHLKRTLIIL